MARNLDTPCKYGAIPSFFGLSFGSDSHHQLHRKSPEKSGLFFVFLAFLALSTVEN